jgi:hypothetical protein
MARTRGRTTPAIAAGATTTTAMRARGPIVPPRATAAMLVAIAATSFVSGFSR